MPRPRGGWRTAWPVLATMVVAGAATTLLAVRQGPSFDELFSFGHVRNPTFGAMLRSYDHSRDATPPTYYAVLWVSGKVLGTGRVALRVPSIVGWVVASGSITWFLRRCRPVAALVGGLVPSASALVGLGAFGRPYGLAFGAGAVGLLAWQRSLERPGHRLPPVALALSLTLAILLHYGAVGMVVALGIVEVVARRRDGDHPRGALVAVAASLLALVAVGRSAGRSSSVQAAGTHNVLPSSLPAFFVTTARPAALLLAVLAIAVGIVWWGSAKAGALAPALRPAEIMAGVALALVPPVTAVAGMWASSGFYLHRYAVWALLGAGVLVGLAADLVVRRSTIGAVLLVVATVACIPIAVHSASDETVSHARMRVVAARMELSRPVVFLDGLVYLQVRDAQPTLDAGSWRIVGPVVIPGTAPATGVDLDALVARSPVTLVGRASDVAEVAAAHRWHVRVTSSASLSYDQQHYSVVTARVWRA